MTRHTLFQDGDVNIPKVIQDQNGQVALGMCKLCGAAESDLIQYKSCEEYMAPEGFTKKQLGLYNKFNVTRTDGKSAEGEKHHNCRYLVLDLDHDPLAVWAVQQYALAAYKESYTALGDDLMQVFREMHLKFFGKEAEASTKPVSW